MRHIALLTVVAVGCVLGLGAPVHAGTSALPVPVPTLFGAGPEVYVSPTMATPTTLIRVVGVGFPVGEHVWLSALDPGAGCSGPCPAVARATVGPHGLFRTAFRAPHYASVLEYTPLIVSVWDAVSGRYRTRTTLVLQQVPQ